VKKSEDLMEEEYKWKNENREVLKIKKKLEINEERMTKHWHEKLTKILIKEEAKLKKRKKTLKEKAEKEYLSAVEKLS
jgi:hypothetical protein